MNNLKDRAHNKIAQEEADRFFDGPTIGGIPLEQWLKKHPVVDSKCQESEKTSDEESKKCE